MPSVVQVGMSNLQPPRGSATRHFEQRAEERALSPQVLAFIRAHGAELNAAGAVHLTVLDRDLPDELRGSELSRKARDWIVIATKEGRPITCYRHRHAWRFLHRKIGSRPPPSRGGAPEGRVE